MVEQTIQDILSYISSNRITKHPSNITNPKNSVKNKNKVFHNKIKMKFRDEWD